MTQYREILRLHSQGISQRNIVVSCACSRNTVSKIILRAEELGITLPLEKDLTDGELRQRLFAEVEKQPSENNELASDQFIGFLKKIIDSVTVNEIPIELRSLIAKLFNWIPISQYEQVQRLLVKLNTV
ncbi:MAG: putative transposase y4bL/y4kJ/y4tB [Bacilli bacterium]|nr:putative transposase y4bL/y4kJ/y4tB [Bacilli bacterium]